MSFVAKENNTLGFQSVKAPIAIYGLSVNDIQSKFVIYFKSFIALLKLY